MAQKIFLLRIGPPLLMLMVFSISVGMPFDKGEMIDQTEMCLMCHEDMEESLRGTAHQVTGEDDLKSALIVGCTGCHDGWDKHIDDPGPNNVVIGPELELLKQAEICSRCHLTSHQAAMLSDDPHGRNNIGCMDCHNVHSNPDSDIAKNNQENYCLTCHPSVALQFKSRSAHPLESGNILCIDCHNLDNIKGYDFAIGLDWICQDCHSEYAGPFIYEHPVGYTHLVDGEGCTECHHAHGSANDFLLKQPKSGLCLQCHMMPPGHRIAHSGLGARHSCVSCHTEIHGSYNNRLFLDPELGMKLVVDCYASGCHSLSEWGGR